MNIETFRETHDDGYDRFEIRVNGKLFMSFVSDEPEDNSIDRNFNDVLLIPDIASLAYTAGRLGETLTIDGRDFNV